MVKIINNRNLLEDVDFIKTDKVKLVMDRGFSYSEQNINDLYKQYHMFLIAANTSLKFIQQKLDSLREDFYLRKHYNAETNLYI